MDMRFRQGLRRLQTTTYIRGTQSPLLAKSVGPLSAVLQARLDHGHSKHWLLDVPDQEDQSESIERDSFCV